MNGTDTPVLRLREWTVKVPFAGGYWTEWYCEVPPDGFRVHPGGDEWSEDPETGEPVRRIYAAEITRPA